MLTNGRQFKPGEYIPATYINDLSESVRTIQEQMSANRLPSVETLNPNYFYGDQVTNLSFKARIVPGGPRGELDYADSRYWVMEVLDVTKSEFVGPPPANAGFPVFTAQREPTPQFPLRWVTAVNLAERKDWRNDGRGETHTFKVRVSDNPAVWPVVRVTVTNNPESGYHYFFEKSAGGGSGIQQLIVKSRAADSLVCRAWNYAEQGDAREGDADLPVAKPVHLRRSTYEGKRFTPSTGFESEYVYRSDDVRELVTYELEAGDRREVSRVTESVYPPWDMRTIGAARTLILATEPAGGTGVVDATNTEITRQDLNDDSRYWKAAATAAAGYIRGTCERLASDTFTIRTSAGLVTVAKQHHHRLSIRSEGTGFGTVNYSEPNIAESSRLARKDPNNVFQKEQLIPQYLAEFDNEYAETITAADVGEEITGIAGVRYMDTTPRIWGRMP